MRSEYREEMKSRQGRPLLQPHGRGEMASSPDDSTVEDLMDVRPLETRDWRELAREVSTKKFEHLDTSMATTIKLEFDNRCFVDGDKQIDYVLAYEDETDDDEATTSQDEEKEKRRQRRKNFQNNLCKMGLQLIEEKADPGMGRTRYVLIHAPFAVLEKQATLLNVKLPVKKCDVEHSGRALMPGCVDRALDKLAFLDFDNETKLFLEEPDYYSASYSSDRRHKARYNSDGGGHEEDDKYRVGIDRLLQNGTYTGAYPLHQELRERNEMKDETLNQRELLYICWANWRVWYKYQPLDLIKRYFGSKVGFYFAWLGYYTKTLYPAAFLGIICVAFGIFQFTKNPVSQQICDVNGPGGKLITCPACNHYCDFQYLNSSCVYSKVSYLFDNTMTVVFAALMSVWASLFLEGWKRYHAEVAWKWGLLDFAVEEDTVRPEFQYRVKTTKWNPITKQNDPYLSGRKRLMNLLASGVTVLFFIVLVLGVVFGIVVYRVIMMQLLARQNSETVDRYAFVIVTATAATINLIVILIMNTVYYYLALVLTRWECPRTQNDFDNSFTVKVFLFQFVNYYSSLFYIAFFKGLLSQLPAYKSKDNSSGGALHIGGTRLEGCDPAGCFAELVIQLAIIMCGRQFFSAFIEILYPLIMSAIRRWQFLLPASHREQEERKTRAKKNGGAIRWESDYFLSPTYDQWLFDEYLEMVIQFGFITLFVAAFPLAPVFALINNIMEIRLDAYKFLVTTQRPMPAQSRNIGIWLQILQFLSNISVTVNALVIAFTSDFIPKLYFMHSYDYDLEGYVDWSLSHFDARELVVRRSLIGAANVTDCRFRGFRNVPCDLLKANSTAYFDQSMIKGRSHCDSDTWYSYSADWWKIIALRLLFVVVFEHFVFLIKMLMDYLIPDIPQKIFIQQQREKYLTRKAVLEDLSSRQGSLRDKRAMKADTSALAFQPGKFEMEEAGHMVDRRGQSLELDSFETASEGSHHSQTRETTVL